MRISESQCNEEEACSGSSGGKTVAAKSIVASDMKRKGSNGSWGTGGIEKKEWDSGRMRMRWLVIGGGWLSSRRRW